MPQQKLTGRSSLLTTRGWLDVAGLVDGVAIIGVDRLGQLSEQQVAIASVGETNEVVYIGSQTAFGQFHPKTALIDLDGQTRTARQIAEQNLIGQWQFENVVSCADCRPDTVTIDSLWNCIERHALARGKSEVVVRARGPCTTEASFYKVLAEDGRDSEPGAMRYAIFGLPQFREAMTCSWQDTVRLLVALLFAVDDDGIIAFDRGMATPCLWRQLLETDTTMKPAELRFDSLQHTATIFMSCSGSHSGSGVSRGGTAFVRKQVEEAYQLTWDEPSWSPVASGFILPAT